MFRIVAYTNTKCIFLAFAMSVGFLWFPVNAKTQHMHLGNSKWNQVWHFIEIWDWGSVGLDSGLGASTSGTSIVSYRDRYLFHPSCKKLWNQKNSCIGSKVGQHCMTKTDWKEMRSSSKLGVWYPRRKLNRDASLSNSEEVADRIRLIYIGIIFGVSRLLGTRWKCVHVMWRLISTYCWLRQHTTMPISL